MREEISSIISKEMGITNEQVEKTIELIDAGNTIPFIARYRKEVTGSLSDVQLRELDDKLKYLRTLNARKDEIIRLITELDKMTDEIMADIESATILSRLEDIYRPFKPKKKTRAGIAKEKGLEPLSSFMLLQPDLSQIDTRALDFVDEEKGVLDVTQAIEGAKDILAEYYSDNADIREKLREYFSESALIKTQLIEGRDEENRYEIYHEFAENVSKIPPHRILAINRAQKDEIIKVSLEIDDEIVISKLKSALDLVMLNEYVEQAFEDAYKRLIIPAIEREIRNTLTEKAEEQAISVFGVNLKQKLMSPPLKDKVIMGFDPAYRTGCKLSVIGKMGEMLDYSTIYPTKPQSKVEESVKTMNKLIDKYQIDVIAIGNGTASRESESFVADVIKQASRKLEYVIVDEAGASVYSASELANSEYPDIDVSIRGAISIGARLQDPLSELVKIDPKSIGVGQYQHDVNQKRLTQVLDAVIEDSVNSVGVDVNIASEVLLSHIAGITKKSAAALVEHRHKNGAFKNRKEIKKVKGIGPVSYQQAIGFLRISGGDNVYDSTGVHPEDYENLGKIIDLLHIDATQIGKCNLGAFESAKKLGLSKLSKDLDIHPVKLEDLLKEIDKPARDPREDVPAPILRSDVLTIDDLQKGMQLKGTVRNIVDFGAFVDIGVKQDGLVHISKMANKFIKHPLDVVKVGDVIDVSVIDIDTNRGKISLSMI